jgi:PAS domain S-box-containing protein
MAAPLRLLIVEDSEDDALLVERELRRAGFDLLSKRVETEETMRSALEEEPWDLVISDYSLPGFNAPAALSTLQASGLDLPFVIVSGTVGEDVAVEGMRAGAHDFFLKGSLTRLAPAVERELEQAAQRRARRKAEDSIRKLSLAVEQAKNAIFMTDPNGAINYLNPAFEEIYGYSRREALGKSPRILKSGQHDQAFYERFWQRLLAGESVREEFVNKRRDGQLVTVETSVSPVLDSEGRRVGFIAVQDDITRRKRAEKEMYKSAERFRSLIENAQDIITVIDLRGTFLFQSPASQRLLGRSPEEFVGRNAFEFVHPEDAAGVREALRRMVASPDLPQTALFRFRHADGSWRMLEGIGRLLIGEEPLQFVVNSRDATDRRALEDQLRLAQKMEAVGQLAGGVAHDFNNLLTAILGYGSLLASRLAPGAPGREEIDEILRASERAAALTKQLLAFSRKQVLEPVVLDVNELIRNLEKLLRRLIEEDVQLVTLLDPSVARVRVDPGQLEQVIMNLVVNARDAMPGGGKLTIETANTSLDEAYAQQHVTVHPGSYVMVSVSDTGIGMDAATKQHFFEPFFTTKEKGKGTGLGLSTVYGIVKQSGGNIWVYSEPGKGTTFKVYLPRVEEIAAEGVPLSANSLPAVGTETILLVEDESSIRALAKRVLEERGYRVLEAGSGKDALELVRGKEGQIHLLLTDLVMPDMGGTELASSLEDKHPAIRVLFMSGYTDDGVVRNGLLGPGRAFLQKPFTPTMLVRKIRDVLA